MSIALVLLRCVPFGFQAGNLTLLFDNDVLESPTLCVTATRPELDWIVATVVSGAVMVVLGFLNCMYLSNK